MHPDTLITYEDAAALFRAANLPSSTRTVRRYIWDHSKLCPLRVENYHTKRVRLADAQRLVNFLRRTTRRGSQKYPMPETMIHGAAPLDTAAARLRKVGGR